MWKESFTYKNTLTLFTYHQIDLSYILVFSLISYSYILLLFEALVSIDTYNQIKNDIFQFYVKISNHQLSALIGLC